MYQTKDGQVKLEVGDWMYFAASLIVIAATPLAVYLLFFSNTLLEHPTIFSRMLLFSPFVLYAIYKSIRILVTLRYYKKAGDLNVGKHPE